MAAPARPTTSSAIESQSQGIEDHCTKFSDDSEESEFSQIRRYTRQELLELRFLDDDQALGKWLKVLQELGPELDSICIESQPNRRTNKKVSEKNSKQQPAFGKPDAYERPLYEQEEEEEAEYDDSSDDDYRKPALYVDGEPDFESGSPQDGFEFLRRVRWEEARCEQVKIAKNSAPEPTSEQTPYMPSISPISVSDPELLPSKEWESDFNLDFANLRKKFSEASSCAAASSTEMKLPHFRDRTAWRVFCFGYAPEHGNSDDATEEEDSAGNDDFGPQPEDCCAARLPYLSILLNLDEVTRAALFCHHVSWLQELESLPEDRAVWLYALAAAVDTPLDADTTAAVRELLRKCAHIRAYRCFRDERELQMLNILITISGKYFGQADS